MKILMFNHLCQGGIFFHEMESHYGRVHDLNRCEDGLGTGTKADTFKNENTLDFT